MMTTPWVLWLAAIIAWTMIGVPIAVHVVRARATSLTSDLDAGGATIAVTIFWPVFVIIALIEAIGKAVR